MADLVPEKQKQVKEFRAKHGDFVVGDVTVDMVSSTTLCIAILILLSLFPTSRCTEACVVFAA